jgi:hypothetical protein
VEGGTEKLPKGKSEEVQTMEEALELKEEEELPQTLQQIVTLEGYKLVSRWMMTKEEVYVRLLFLAEKMPGEGWGGWKLRKEAA